MTKSNPQPAADIAPEGSIISDLYRITTALGVSDTVARMICAEVQHHCGGGVAYIPKTTADDRRWLSVRDAAIVREYRRGEHPRFLAGKYNIGLRRVQQIVKAESETL